MLRSRSTHSHIPLWHDALKRSGKAIIPFRTTFVQDAPRREGHGSTPCFPVGCWSQMNDAWVSCRSRIMSQNCDPQSARHSGLQQTYSALDIPRNFRGVTIAPLCSRRDLVGPVPKGRWRLSWTNRCYGRILGLLMGTKFETPPMKWLETSRFSSSKESAPYTMCCENDVHCGVWHWWGNTALRCYLKSRW